MRMLLIIAGITLVALTVNAQKVQVGADPNLDLSKYKTYTWDKSSPSGNPIIHRMIVDEVDKAMTAKGLQKTETDPELTVVIWAATESDMHISHPSWSPALNSISTGVVVGSSAWPVTKGTLVVELSDTKSKSSVWRATATDTLEHGPTGNAGKDAKSVAKPIRKAVEKMFKQFPRVSRK